MNGVSQNSATPAAETASWAWSVLSLVLLLSPCLASAVFAMRDQAAPALRVSDVRPALVFGSYMIPAGPEPVGDDPVIVQDFEFMNKGRKSVRITELVPSCGCLSPHISLTEIPSDENVRVTLPVELPPGKHGRVVLPIRTANQDPGIREYIVNVKYEDPKPRQVTLTFKVNLPEKKIVIQPKVLMLMGKVTGEHPYIVTISDHRRNLTASPMKITGVTGSSSLFTAESAGHTVAEGVSTSAVSVTFNEPIPAGQHKGVILVSTDDRLFPILQIPVVVGDPKRPIDESVSVSPAAATVVINSADPEKSLGTTVSFEIPANWIVTHFDAFPAELIAKALSTEPITPQRVRVTAELTVSALPAQGVDRGVLTLHATDGNDPEMVTVPVSFSGKR